MPDDVAEKTPGYELMDATSILKDKIDATAEYDMMAADTTTSDASIETVQKKKPSLEEVLYNDFYEAFGRDKDKDKVGKLAGILSNLGRYARYVCGTAAIGLGIDLSYGLSSYDITAERIIMDGGLMIASAGLTVHMHEVKKIFESMARKNQGEELAEKEISDIQYAGKIGRYSHLAAGTALLVSLCGLMVTYPPALIMAPILPFWYALVIKEGYGALYSSAVDYTVGQRRKF